MEQVQELRGKFMSACRKNFTHTVKRMSKASPSPKAYKKSRQGGLFVSTSKDNCEEDLAESFQLLPDDDSMLRVIPTNIDSTFGWQREEIPYREQTKYRGRGISQQFELLIMRSKVKPVWRVQNLTDSSIFSEERHVKIYWKRSQSLFLFPTDLGRSKRLCSQGILKYFKSTVQHSIIVLRGPWLTRRQFLLVPYPVSNIPGTQGC